jgi:enolase-phosphatase E1
VRGTIANVQAIVLDIEGTTTPIAFVYDVLFAFARRHLRAYLDDPDNAVALREILSRLREEWAADHGPAKAGHYVRGEGGDGDDGDRDDGDRDDGDRDDGDGDDGGRDDDDVFDAQAYVEWLMDQDRKSPALKLLQGRIWEQGYRRGELRGEVFADVAPALRRWREAGLDVAIYSSGSELAQRLLFGTTIEGDLTPLVARFFDTAVGAKQAPDSYQGIARELGCSADRMLFVSDVTTELDAAKAAGCQTLLCVRPGNRPQPPHDYDVIQNFDEIGL